MNLNTDQHNEYVRDRQLRLLREPAADNGVPRSRLAETSSTQNDTSSSFDHTRSAR
jgi:hypothetical protein